MDQTSLWVTYQSLFSAIIGAAFTAVLWILTRLFNERQKTYERRYAIYKALISNVRNVVSFEFVSSYNMLLVEFQNDKKILAARDKFLDCVNREPAKDEDGQKRQDVDFVHYQVGKKSVKRLKN